MRRFNPLSPDHPLVGAQCPACHETFVAGSLVTLVALGPGASEENREKCRKGRPYNAVAAAVHYACATGELDG